MTRSAASIAAALLLIGLSSLALASQVGAASSDLHAGQFCALSKQAYYHARGYTCRRGSDGRYRLFRRSGGGGGGRVFGAQQCIHPRARPSNIVLTCGDANLQVLGIRWSRWGGGTARGHGTWTYNDCNPYCAAGHFHRIYATVALYRIGHCRGYGSRRFYTRAIFRGRFRESGRVWHVCPLAWRLLACEPRLPDVGLPAARARATRRSRTRLRPTKSRADLSASRA